MTQVKESQLLIDLRFLPGNYKNIEYLGKFIQYIESSEYSGSFYWLFTGLSLLELKSTMDNKDFSTLYKRIIDSPFYLAGYSGSNLSYLSKEERIIETQRGIEVCEALQMPAIKGLILETHKNYNTKEWNVKTPIYFLNSQESKEAVGTIEINKKYYYHVHIDPNDISKVLDKKRWSRSTIFYCLSPRDISLTDDLPSFNLLPSSNLVPLSSKTLKKGVPSLSPASKAPYFQPYEDSLQNGGDSKLVNIHKGLRKYYFPKQNPHKIPEGMVGGIPDRDLSFNMQGSTQFQLATEFVHFVDGRLSKVSFPPTSYTSLGPISSYIKTEQGVQNFHTRSSFSITGDNYWGMREVLDLETNTSKAKLIIEYLSFVEFPHLFISYTVSYPPSFKGRIDTLAPIELPLIPLNRFVPVIAQTGDTTGIGGKEKIDPVKGSILWGNAFNFNSGQQHISLIFPNLGGQNIVPITLGTTRISGKKYLTAFPGGSTTTISGSNIEGWEEHLSFYIKWERHLQPDSYKIPETVKKEIIPPYSRQKAY
ncbi:hypothetical protein [Spirochaeta cellobiosiphila]|uniref:hypothetical protein n=1 Tax=Spirochaeta cellobiosiphila TaxID=504483 RepID=UPI000408E6B1|nr:hypothetical protein [Spirochaeta cellobiosiphila]